MIDSGLVCIITYGIIGLIWATFMVLYLFIALWAFFDIKIIEKLLFYTSKPIEH